MSDGQEGDELASKISDFGVGETYVSGNELGANLLGGLVAAEQGFPHENQSVIGYIAATGSKPEKILGAKEAGTGAAFIYRLVGNERSVHAQHQLSPGLPDNKLPAAAACLLFR
jgi:hypothetical protein